MAEGADVNEAERRRWNDEYWAAVWPKREQLTGAVTEPLLAHLRLAGGEHVLDVGSGAGIASLAAARAVGAAGSVLGVDISRPLVEYATRRADQANVPNVRFDVADAQRDPVGGAPFDAALSQFGVMFFADPVAAFGNIRAQLASGARLAFACWQPVTRNPWYLGHAVARFIRPPASPGPGIAPPGPFSLGEADRTTAMLGTAGWSDISRTPYEMAVVVDRDALFDEAQLGLMGVRNDQLDAARDSVERHLSGLRRADGRYDAPLAFQVFTATA